MLTFSDPQTIAQADHYFQKDMDYYLGMSRVLGHITGQVAKELEIDNTQISTDTYAMHTMLCHGKLGERKLVSMGAGKKHAAGFDVTMADPKELSCMIAYAKVNNHPLAQILEQTHERAVEKTFAFIQRYAGYRKSIDGKSTFVRSGKLIASRFYHETNRFDEPHRHDHNFIYNVTIDDNGKTRALENFYLFKHQDLFHQIWHTNLAHELHKIGIETEITDYKKGTFSIKSFDPAITEHYSKRSKQIEEIYKSEEVKLNRELTYAEKETIKLKLRPSKSKRCIDDIRDEFASNLEARFDFSMDAIHNVINPNLHPFKLSDDALGVIIVQAAEAINETQACFSYEELLKGVLKLTHGKNYTIDIAVIEHAIENHEELIRFSDETITTKTFHELEKKIIQNTLKGRDFHSPVFEKQAIRAKIEEKGLTVGQMNAIEHILSASDTLIGIQGDAGSGKTYMLRWANQIAQEEIEFQGLAFTGAAAAEIEHDSGIKSTTIHGFLAAKSDPNTINNKRKVWVVDEASMVGSRLMHSLMQHAKDEKAQIVLVGDIKQYQSISAGTIFHDLQRLNVMKTVTMSEVKRQEEQCLIDAVAAINQGKDYTKAFDLINQHQMVNEIENNDERIDAIVNAYLASDPHQSLLMAGTNKERYFLNSSIRRRLLENNTIQDERECSVLTNINIRDIDKSFAQNYQAGQILIANQQGILGKNGEKGIIVSTDIKKHTITVKKIDGTNHRIDLAKHGSMISTYQPNKKQFGEGERIMFGRNYTKMGVKNGQIGIIKQIDGNRLMIDKQGKEIIIDMQNYPFIDYAYTITDIKAQGKTARNVIVAASAKRASQESFYVQLTRAKSNIQFFVDDAQKFRISIENEKSKNSTLHKSIQRINYERDSRIKGDVTSAGPNHALTRQPREQNQLNRASDLQEYYESGKYPNYNRSDSYNAHRPSERVGWKLELCRSRRFLEQVNGSNGIDTGFSNNAKQQNGDSIRLMFDNSHKIDEISPIQSCKPL